jgi:[acyl-carrier-protein] S-malonyltransferase
MEPAVEPLCVLAANIQVNDPTCGVISNKDGAVIRDGREVLDRIVAQISNPVRWDLCMTTLSESVSGALEVPPAGTLVGLLKRAVPIVETFALKAVTDISLADEFALRHNQEVSN